MRMRATSMLICSGFEKEHVQKSYQIAAATTAASKMSSANLESILKQLGDALEQKEELERQHAQAVAQLREKKSVEQHGDQSNEKDKKPESEDSVEALQSKIRELEKKTELQIDRKEELMLELAALKRSRQCVQVSPSRQSSVGHSPDSPFCSTPGTDLLSGYTSSRDLSGIFEPSGLLRCGPNSMFQVLHAMGSNVPLPQFQRLAAVLPTNLFPAMAPAGHLLTSQGPTLFAANCANPSALVHPLHQVYQSFQGPLMNNPVALVHQPIPVPQIITTADVANKTVEFQQAPAVNGATSIVLPQQPGHHHQFASEQQAGTSTANAQTVDTLDIPGKGRRYVYIARYSYDPIQQSPNENLDAELYLSAGDYLLVSGNMDEDGFLDGELLNGRRGLVPSNYVERLVGEDLLAFHQQASLGNLGIYNADDYGSTSLAEFDRVRDLGDESQRLIIEELMHRRQEEYGYLNLEEIIDDGNPEKQVPPPAQLTLERELNKSVLIGWNPPDCPTGLIECYQVYVNGLLRCTVKGNERTRALVEGVDCNRPHRISVRAVTHNRKSSPDAACTMVVGKNAPLCPSYVRASGNTSTSAVISWLPSNSNFQHVVCVNNVEIRTVKPGVHRHTITGLNPNTTYRVTVRSKTLKAVEFDDKTGISLADKLSSHTEFRTLPKGLPDPPIDVQIEPGPQHNTVLVTWHPVTAGTSNGSVVTGYAVFADGQKVLEIDSPLGDHALLDLNRFQTGMPTQVTVRTKSRERFSSDSVPTVISSNALKGKMFKNIPQAENNCEDMLSDSDMGMYPPNPREPLPGYGNMPQTSMGTRIYPNPTTRPPLPPQPGRSIPPKGPHQVQGYHPPPHPMANAPPPPHPRFRNQPPPPPPVDNYAHGHGRPPKPGRQPQPQQPEIRHRVFVALFDYHPQSMSPNPAACEEELPFREGQTIKIYGEKDADGFYWGEAFGRKGYVPCNMVSEVSADDERMAQEYFGEREHLVSGRERRAMGKDRWGDIYANMPVKKMVALYDYDPRELSPNVDSEVELSFVTGDVIFVYGDMDDDGFFMGEINNIRGLVPSNFLTEVPPDYEKGGRGRGRPPANAHSSPQNHRKAGPSTRGAPPVPARENPGPASRKEDPNARKDALYPLEHSELMNNSDGQMIRRGGKADSTRPTHPKPSASHPHSTDLALSDLKIDDEPVFDIDAALPELSPLEETVDLTVPTTTAAAVTPTTNAGETSEKSANPITSKLPGVLTEGPAGSLIQKFSDLTSTIGGGGEGGEGSILSKGKDLSSSLFKRFGF